MMLPFSNMQVCWQATQSVCACVGACVSGYPLTFTVLFWAALDHWNVLRHQKKTDTSKQRVFAKLWNALWGFGDFCDVQGPVGRKGKRWQERSTVRLQEIKRRRYHSNPLPWLSTCHNSLHSSNLQWMQDTARLFKLWLSAASPNGAESCWVDTLLKIFQSWGKLCNKVKHVCRNSCLLYNFCS